MEKEFLTDSGDLFVTVNLHEIAGTYKQLEAEIISAGGMIILTDVTNEKNDNNFGITGSESDFQTKVESGDKAKTYFLKSIVINDVDGYPVRFTPQRIRAVSHPEIAGNHYTALSYYYGDNETIATAKFHGRFYQILLKFWAKFEELSVIVNLTDYKEDIDDRLSEISGYRTFWEKILEIRGKKNEVVREQRWEDAASLRDQEKRLVEESNFLVKEKEKIISEFVQIELYKNFFIAK